MLFDARKLIWPHSGHGGQLVKRPTTTTDGTTSDGGNEEHGLSNGGPGFVEDANKQKKDNIAFLNYWLHRSSSHWWVTG